MNWLLIIVAILALVLVLKLVHFRHKVFVATVVAILLFAIISFNLATKDHTLNLSSPSGLIEAGKVYFLWFGQAFTNMKTITANVVKMNWIPAGRNISDITPGFMTG